MGSGGGDAPTQPDHGWIEGEPGLREAWRELARLARRARFHWGATLLLAIMAAGIVLTMRVVTPESYPAELVLSVTEGDLEGTAVAPRTATRLQDYVVNAVFSDARLLEVMQRHEISAAMRRKNEPAAIYGFREDITVEVSRNHFI